MLRLIGGIVVLALIVLGFGLWRDWFDVSNQRAIDGEREISLSVDNDKIAADAAAAKAKAKSIAGDAKDAIGDAVGVEETEGSVTAVDDGARRITVSTKDGSVLPLHIDSGVEITIDGQATTFSSLGIGQRVTVTFEDHDGVRGPLKHVEIRQPS